MEKPAYSRNKDYISAHFNAMASPCELLIDTTDQQLAEKLATIAQQETLRIEQKFSRYRDDNIIHAINHSIGEPVEVDRETADLLDYAQQCYQISDGMFDITSGVLRRIWRFDGSSNIPDQQRVSEVLKLVGWQKVKWQRPMITLQPGMEIDLGGIGKEYAVDRVAQLLLADSNTSCLINFGGDLRVTAPRHDGSSWIIAVESPDASNTPQPGSPSLLLSRGAIATSGDAKRYLLKDGVRYSHILNPKTGWPVTGGPRSITVAANTCTEAGILSTLALLHGKDAEEFLTIQDVQYWCEW